MYVPTCLRSANLKSWRLSKPRDVAPVGVTENHSIISLPAARRSYVIYNITVSELYGMDRFSTYRDL
jgi:hypothetical protein